MHQTGSYYINKHFRVTHIRGIGVDRFNPYKYFTINGTIAGYSIRKFFLGLPQTVEYRISCLGQALVYVEPGWGGGMGVGLIDLQAFMRSYLTSLLQTVYRIVGLRIVNNMLNTHYFQNNPWVNGS